MITAWRVCKASRAATAFDGQGAALAPGRWNSRGVPVAYTAESRSLASMEVLVHVEDRSLLQSIRYVAIPVSFDAALVHSPDQLPADWRALPAPASTRALGDAWVESGRSLVLRLPSAVTTGEFNYLINPRHPDFGQLEIGAPEPLVFDPRLG